jgi:hypothetical protein
MAKTSGRGFIDLERQEQQRSYFVQNERGGKGGRGNARDWSQRESAGARRLDELASHHERASFHHETASFHHGQAAKHFSSGNHAVASQHAEAAEAHGEDAQKQGAQARSLASSGSKSGSEDKVAKSEQSSGQEIAASALPNAKGRGSKN